MAKNLKFYVFIKNFGGIVQCTEMLFSQVLGFCFFAQRSFIWVCVWLIKRLFRWFLFITFFASFVSTFSPCIYIHTEIFVKLFMLKICDSSLMFVWCISFYHSLWIIPILHVLFISVISKRKIYSKYKVAMLMINNGLLSKYFKDFHHIMLWYSETFINFDEQVSLHW